MRRTSGFTLIEVMLVLVIIAIAYTLLPRMVFSGVSGAELKPMYVRWPRVLHDARQSHPQQEGSSVDARP